MAVVRAPDIVAACPAETTASHDAAGGSPLSPNMTFGNFAVGQSNQIAYSAAGHIAITIACKSTPTFNPLYIHSAVGLGKTHLLQAIAWDVNAAGRNALYLTAEKFMFAFGSALRERAELQALRCLDLLLVDDIQHLRGKAIQGEFCHTINALIDAGKTLVVAADRPPIDCEHFEPRLQSRLAGGLVLSLESTNVDLRLGVLNKRIGVIQTSCLGFYLNPQVLQFIAETLPHSNRDLDGAIMRLAAHAQITGEAITMQTAETIIRDLIRPQEPKRIRIEEIQRFVARHYNVTRNDILSQRRTANIVRPRQVAMYLCKVMTLRSLPEIGRRFGGKDHTTVLHAVRKIERLLQEDRQLAAEIEALKRQM